MTSTTVSPQPAVLQNLIEYQADSIVSKEILKTPSGTISLFAFAEGQGLSEHTAPFDVLAHIIDGNAQITISGAINTVSAGEIIRMPANEPHSVHAPSPFKMLLIMLRK